MKTAAAPGLAVPTTLQVAAAARPARTDHARSVAGCWFSSGCGAACKETARPGARPPQKWEARRRALVFARPEADLPGNRLRHAAGRRAPTAAAIAPRRRAIRSGRARSE